MVSRRLAADFPYMKNSAVKPASLRAHLFIVVSFFAVPIAALCQRNSSHNELSANEKNEFISNVYNHFEGGILFRDVEKGLDILWSASFKGKRVYKENAAFFVPDGLLILPNKENTTRSASLSALPVQIREGKLFVLFEGILMPVLGIVHTHIDGLPEPTPRNDYQYGYTGIHNYIMSYVDLFDAFKNSQGNEVYSRMGSRSSVAKIVNDLGLGLPSEDALVAKSTK